MTTTDVDPALAESIRRLEARIEALEQWRREREGAAPSAAVLKPSPAPEAAAGTSFDFDLALVGLSLIILGGAYLLRAVTESGLVAPAVGVAVGLLYACGWSAAGLRSGTSRSTATYYGVAASLIALPLIFEAVRKFHVLGPWGATAALAVASAVILGVSWWRRLAGVAWTFTIIALVVTPLLMAETKAIVPFVFYLTALGLATLWMGYVLDWRMLRWPVAAEIDTVLLILSFLVTVNRVPGVSPAIAILVASVVFAAYVGSFAVRTLLRGREVLPFEIVQTLALLAAAVGGAMWVAASRGTGELAVAAVVIALGAGSYAVSFAFIPRRFETPVNFVSYSTLALILIVAGGAFIATGFANSILWAVLALTCSWFAGHYRKSSLALHAAVYLFAGFVGAGVVRLGFESLLLPVDRGWLVPTEGSVVLLVATAIAAMIPPIERRGTFELWTAAKVMLLAELGWIAASLLVTAIGFTLFSRPPWDAAVIGVVRTAVLVLLTVLTAWASRFVTLSPGRHLCSPLLVLLVIKLLAEDFRTGRPATLFVSLALAGVAFIATTKLRRHAAVPVPVERPEA